MDKETLRQIGDALSHQQKTLKQLAALLERLQTLREQPEVDPLWSDRDFVQCNVFAAKRAAELGERVYVVRYGQGWLNVTEDQMQRFGIRTSEAVDSYLL